MDTSDQNQGGLLKWHPMLAGKTALSVNHSSSPSCEMVGLASGVMPNSTSSSTGTAVTLGSEKNLSAAQMPCSIEIAVKLAKELKQKSLSSPMKISGSQSKIHGGGTNTLDAGTLQESEAKTVQFSPRILPPGNNGTRGLKAAGQREAQGQCQGQTSLVYIGANCSFATKGPSCRGTVNAYAKPFAS